MPNDKEQCAVCGEEITRGVDNDEARTVYWEDAQGYVRCQDATEEDTEHAPPAWIMSPQAHRRLLSTLSTSELRDLATEIGRDLEAKMDGAVIGEDEHNVILRTLTRDF